MPMAIDIRDALIEYWAGEGVARQGGVWVGGGWNAPHLHPAPVGEAIVKLPVSGNEAP